MLKMARARPVESLRVVSHCSLYTRLPVVITRGPRVQGPTAAVAPRSPCSARRADPRTLPSPSSRETASNLSPTDFRLVLLIYSLCMVSYAVIDDYVTTTVRFIHARITLAKVCLEAQLIG